MIQQRSRRQKKKSLHKLYDMYKINMEPLTQELYDTYVDMATIHAHRWGVTDNKVIHIILSMLLYRDGYWDGSGFIEAVLRNDLSKAIDRADELCMTYLKVIVSAKNLYM